MAFYMLMLFMVKIYTFLKPDFYYSTYILLKYFTYIYLLINQTEKNKNISPNFRCPPSPHSHPMTPTVKIAGL